MVKDVSHKWEFKARFRRHAFGWKSQPAITRIKQAVTEIKQAAKKAPVLAAEGAVLFLERVSPALAHVDSSSGAIGTAVNHAISELVPLIASAPVDAATRDAWLERLWEAYQADDIPYIESLGHHWGTLCAAPEVASAWADRLIGTVRLAWSPSSDLRGFFKGTTNCLSALVAAGRHDDVLALLELAPYRMWHDRQYGVKALAAQGRTEEALRYAEAERNDSPYAVARACEALLLAEGRAEEAYQRHGLLANQGGTYLATFRAVARKYPHKAAGEVLADLVRSTPGEEGKWFAAAKDAGLYEEALGLARQTPCDPKTLTRAAQAFAKTQPAFALEAGLLALHWLVQGHGYEVTSLDVCDAYRATCEAAEQQGASAGARARIRALLAAGGPGRDFVAGALASELAS
ncbi:hypothetical protein [Corallococcus macrosporus]|uniref:Uncharacterized protein n=1 Tax=Corallococcus macrosporus DSM 14697 TaxID=1189310 RepID=A0A286NVW0_9BACT|nr:hypothetical protein [Corallococcus macrosporus]ATB51305.1 hypothetical protein MYMAC_006963 [Corallococcus macrosporus DSM 14697]